MKSRACAGLLFAASLVACSSSSSGSPAGSGPGFDAGGPNFDGAARDSGSTGDTGSPAEASTGDGGPTVVHGNFGFQEDTLVQTSSSDVFVRGSFAVYSASDGCPSPTAVVPMGCTMNNCYGLQSTPQKYLSAGTVTMTGGTPSVTMTPNSMGTYSFSAQVGEFGGSGMLTLAATGAEVPAFQVSLAKIGYVSLTAPTSGQGASSSQDLTVSWTGGTSGSSVYVSFPSKPNQIICRFDAAAGTGVIPTALLSHLTPDPQHGLQLDAYEYDDAMLMVGSIPVLVQNFHDDFGANHPRVNLQ